MHPHRPISAWTHGDRITRRGRPRAGVRPRLAHRGAVLHRRHALRRPAWTLAGVEHVLGAESRAETGEPHAAERADPARPAGDHRLLRDRASRRRGPHDRQAARSTSTGASFAPPGWPGPLLGWTTLRPGDARAADALAVRGRGQSPVVALPPHPRPHELRDGFAPQRHHRRQLAPERLLVRAGRRRRRRPSARSNLEAARQLSLSLLYWLQTEAPRPDGGVGYPGLRLRGDVVGGTADGLALAPYVRESRRLRAEFTVLEQHIAHPLRPDGPKLFADSRRRSAATASISIPGPAAPATSTSAAGRSRSRSAR